MNCRTIAVWNEQYQCVFLSPRSSRRTNNFVSQMMEGCIFVCDTDTRYSTFLWENTSLLLWRMHQHWVCGSSARHWNMVDFSRFQKSLRASKQDLCIETWHFTVSTRGQIHKRTSNKSSQNLCEWRKPWSSCKILSLLLQIDWYLLDTYFSHVLWSGKWSWWGQGALSVLGLKSWRGATRWLQTL